MSLLGATRAYPLAFALGLIAACGFAPLELWPLTLLSFAGLIALLDQATTLRRAAALGWWFGMGYFGLGLNWIATAFTYQAAMPAWLGWVAVVLLSLYLAVFPAIAASAAWLCASISSREETPAISAVREAAPLPARGLATWFSYTPSVPRLAFGARLIPFMAAWWIVAELARATLFTGFPWNPAAAIWVPVGLVPELTTVVGTYGLSGLTVGLAGTLLMAARAPLVAWKAAPEQRGGRILLVLILPAALIFGLAPAVLRASGSEPTPEAAGAPLLHVVQPNIGQERKWDAEQSADNYHRLASLSGKPGPRPRIVLWPEVAVPALLEQDPLARRTLASLLGPRDLMLTGAEAVRFSPDGDPLSASNSLFGLDPHGNLLGRYDKAHLVPYGEYLPMRPLLSRIGLSRLAPGDMDFDAGPGPRDILLPGVGKVGVQICYEIIFSGHVIDRANRPLFLFNPSNDAWFGRWGPPQHLAQARLRAAEEGLPVVRSTPTGISAVIDADGRLLASLPWRTAGAIELPLPPAHAPTLFARWGNILPLMLALFLGAIGFASRRRAS